MKEYTEALVFRIVEENYEDFVVNFDQTFQIFFGRNKCRDFIRELLNKVLFECKLEKNYIHLMVEIQERNLTEESLIDCEQEYQTMKKIKA